MKPFFISSPHSGEKVPTEVSWLSHHPEPILMCDVDRFVDQLYEPFSLKHQVPFVSTPWHRYVADLNRLPDDVDKDSVLNHKNPSGTHTTGLHWVQTTKGDVLMAQPISTDLHASIVEKYHSGFHKTVSKQYSDFFKSHKSVYHLDAHSMPSRGTSGGAHRDPGELRAEIVVSDQDGLSCSAKFRDLVVQGYRSAGFEVKLNWPYKGGRVTQTYGLPQKGQHCIQVELNRSLYMDELTKQKKPALFASTQLKIEQALLVIYNGIDHL